MWRSEIDLNDRQFDDLKFKQQESGVFLFVELNVEWEKFEMNGLASDDTP